jgi:ketosteroid isomerase-like protein
MKHTILLFKRHSKKFFTTLLLFPLCVFNLSAQTTKDTSTVKKQIMVLNQQMENAFNSNDMNKVAAFYADDSEIVYDDNYTVKGRSDLDNYWLTLKDKGRGWKLTVVEIGGQGDFVYQLGKSDLKHLSQGKVANSITNFVLIWKKQADGNYKIFRDYLTKTKFEKN